VTLTVCHCTCQLSDTQHIQALIAQLVRIGALPVKTRIGLKRTNCLGIVGSSGQLRLRLLFGVLGLDSFVDPLTQGREVLVADKRVGVEVEVVDAGVELAQVVGVDVAQAVPGQVQRGERPVEADEVGHGGQRAVLEVERGQVAVEFEEAC